MTTTYLKKFVKGIDHLLAYEYGLIRLHSMNKLARNIGEARRRIRTRLNVWKGRAMAELDAAGILLGEAEETILCLYDGCKELQTWDLPILAYYGIRPPLPEATRLEHFQQCLFRFDETRIIKIERPLARLQDLVAQQTIEPDPQPDAQVAANPAAADRRKKKATLNMRMANEIQRNQDAMGFTISQWQRLLHCKSRSGIARTPTWNNLANHRESLKAARRQDRRRRTTRPPP